MTRRKNGNISSRMAMASNTAKGLGLQKNISRTLAGETEHLSIWIPVEVLALSKAIRAYACNLAQILPVNMFDNLKA